MKIVMNSAVNPVLFIGNSEFLVGGQKTKSENEAGQRRPGIVVFWIQGLSSGGFTQKLG
jgi:hypothetical protein